MRDMEIIEIDGVKVRNIPEIPDHSPAHYANAKYIYKGFSICQWDNNVFCIRPSEFNINTSISSFFLEKIGATLDKHPIDNSEKPTSCMIENTKSTLPMIIETIDKFWLEVMGIDPTGLPHD